MNQPKPPNTADAVIFLPEQIRKIGNTTYKISTHFNGDERRDIASALVRLIGRDAVSSRTTAEFDI